MQDDDSSNEDENDIVNSLSEEELLDNSAL